MQSSKQVIRKGYRFREKWYTVYKMVRGSTMGGASPKKHLLSAPLGLCHAICYLFRKLYCVFISIEFQK